MITMLLCFFFLNIYLIFSEHLSSINNLIANYTYSWLIVRIIYHIHCVCNGKNFAIRQVDAQQNGSVIFILLASFQVMTFIADPLAFASSVGYFVFILSFGYMLIS